jgi:hypothetical protein
MHPFIIQSIAAERVRDRQDTAEHGRWARLARNRRLRQRQVLGTQGTVRLLPARLRLHTL